ncbi:MAG: hypothetical protein JJT94_08960 [Bernardetiaceae bacterium]|nr:hypothetical protein [Bernardetiaceae bacterium]
MKKLLFPLILLLAALTFVTTSCEENFDGEGSKFRRLEALSRSWNVTEARFGREVAPGDWYNSFSIAFTSDGQYLVTNPDGRPAGPLNTSGTWEFANNETVLVFDRGTQQETRILIAFLSASGDNMEWEWDVTLPGKARTTYQFKLVPAQ